MVRGFARAAVLFLALPLMSFALASGTAAATPTATATATVSTFTAPTLNDPDGIALGPDGALWFTNLGNSSIGRITTSGVITNFGGVGIANPEEITAGPDGALWFTNVGGLSGSIGRITTAGVVTTFAQPGIVYPQHIAAGPDGALWFTNTEQTGPDGGVTSPWSIGRITTAGALTTFTDPGIAGPQGLTAGPDGAVWFTDGGAGGPIGRLTPAGVVTTFTSPALKNSHPEEITAGPDGALWFTTSQNASIGRITTSGAITLRTNPTIQHPYAITAGGDGAMWFTNVRTRTIGRITTANRVVTNYTGTGIAYSTGIVQGPDGAMWFTNQLGDSIGRIAPGRPLPPRAIVPGSASVVEGNSGTTELRVPVSLSIPSTQTVTAHWSTVFATNGSTGQADPSSDYTAASGTVTFSPGAVSQTVPISVNGDTLVEPDEFIIVSFTDATNAVIRGVYGLGVGYITNDD